MNSSRSLARAESFVCVHSQKPIPNNSTAMIAMGMIHFAATQASSIHWTNRPIQKKNCVIVEGGIEWRKYSGAAMRRAFPYQKAC